MKGQPTDKQATLIFLSPDTLARYRDADEEVQQILGLSPGPEFLMSLAVEYEDPFELSSVFLSTIVEALRAPEASSLRAP